MDHDLLSLLRPDVRLELSSGDALDVRRFALDEALSELFSIRIVARTPDNDLDFDAVLAKPARFTLSGAGGTKTWDGIVSEIDLVRVEPAGLATYELTIRPRLWLLSQRRNYRVFQMTSEIDIVRSMLEEWGIEHEVAVDPDRHVPRKYKVQYAESDLDFVRRLLEDVGATFSFVPATPEHPTRVRIDDAPEQRALDLPLVPFLDAPGVTAGPHVTAVRVSQRVRPGAVTVGDVDYRRRADHQPRLGASTGLPEERALEQYRHEPGAFLFAREGRGATPSADDRGTSRTDETLGADRARVRLDAERVGAKQVELRTNLVALSAGHTLSIAGYTQRTASPEKKLLVVEVKISGAFDEPAVVLARLLPTESPVRPAFATDRPRVVGLESATVVGPGGQQVHTDEFGRVRVQFHWDREGRRDERSSCWVPVSQALGGAGFGAVSLPRVGQEVLVEFLGGDPDRPVVVGRVYTETQPVPYPLPRHRTVTGLRSATFTPGPGEDAPPARPSPLGPRTTETTPDPAALVQDPAFGARSPGGNTHAWAGSELTFDDTSGGSLVYLQADRDMNSFIRHAQVTNVGAHRVTDVGSDDVLRVHDRQQISVDGAREILVRGEQRHHVVGDVFQSSEASQQFATTDTFRSSAAHHEIVSNDTIVFRVGTSVLLMTPSYVLIQADRVHVNPGIGVAQRALDDPNTPIPTAAEVEAAEAARREAARLERRAERQTTEQGGAARWFEGPPEQPLSARERERRLATSSRTSQPEVNRALREQGMAGDLSVEQVEEARRAAAERHLSTLRERLVSERGMSAADAEARARAALRI